MICKHRSRRRIKVECNTLNVEAGTTLGGNEVNDIGGVIKSKMADRAPNHLSEIAVNYIATISKIFGQRIRLLE